MNPEPFNWEEKKKMIFESYQNSRTSARTLSEEEEKSYNLLDKAKWQMLSEKEIKYVADKLKNKAYENVVDLSVLIETLGWAKAVQHRDLVEEYLYYPQQEFVAASALKALCRYMGLAGEYVEQIKLFLEGLEWTRTGEVWIEATSCAGAYLRNHYDRELLVLLLKKFEDQEEASDIRADAYCALAEAAGNALDDIPSSFSIERSIDADRFDLIDMSVIEKVKMRLKENQ